MNDTTLMVMRGSQSIAVQKQITFVTQEDKNDDGFVGKVVLEQVGASFDAKSANIAQKNQYETEQDVIVDEDLTVLHVADESRANPKMYEQQTNGLKRKRMDVDEDMNEEEDTKSDQVQPLTKKQKVESMTFQDKLYQIERQTEENKNSGLGMDNLPNADSLYILLTQSLASNDQAMFDRLLLMQNDDAMREFEGDLIKNTLDRISSGMAVQLLEKLTEKFRVSPRQSISILRWLLPLLNSHSASFSKEMSSRKDLISVHQAIDYQIKSLLPAMKLQGRLSLLMNQMDKVNEFNAQKKGMTNMSSKGLEMARTRPLFVHDEEKIEEDEKIEETKENNED